MKYLIVLIIAGFLGVSSVVLAQDKQNDAKQTHGTQTICPVMEEPIDKDIFVDYEGKRIYVCCYSCYDTVKADPEKYIKQLESQGVILEKVPDENAKKQTPVPITAVQDNSAAHQH